MRFNGLHLSASAVAGVALGYFLQPAPRVSPEGAKPAASEATALRPRDRPGGMSPGVAANLRREIRASGPRALPRLAYRALELPDASERREALLEAIRSSPDAATCLEILEQFNLITRETGRTHAPLFSAALFEGGKLYGTDMLDAWMRSSESPSYRRLWESLYGAAYANPAAALAWLDRPDVSAYAERGKLISAVIGGAALNDPDQASALMAALPPEERHASIQNFVYNVTQSHGISRTVDWMLEVQASAGPAESQYASSVEAHVFSKLVGAAGSTGGTQELARHLERIHNARPISQSRILETLSRLGQEPALALLDHLASSQVKVLDSAGGLQNTLALHLADGRAGTAAADWLERNPESPLAPHIRARLATPDHQ